MQIAHSARKALMFNKYRQKNNSKMERILYYIACELDFPPSQLKELIYVSTEIIDPALKSGTYAA
jgi:hypothetical protein